MNARLLLVICVNIKSVRVNIHETARKFKNPFHMRMVSCVSLRTIHEKDVERNQRKRSLSVSEFFLVCDLA